MKKEQQRDFCDPRLLYLFNEGKYYFAFETFGAHPATEAGEEGFRFTVWAPNVRRVRVIGEYNDWSDDGVELAPQGETGVWSGFVAGVKEYMLYKYLIETASGELLYKADPFAFYAEQRPGTASAAYDLSNYKWHDDLYMTNRRSHGHFSRPKNIYEVHLGSWRQHPSDSTDPDDLDKFYTYRELAEELVPYVKKMGYTHIELLPVMEHPFDGSWGYQITGYFAPTSRYGTPEDFMYLIDRCHRSGIGVILDWVPGHFCRDIQGLGRFNGEMLYEKSDHKQWGTYKFDFGRSEVRGFLLSNAIYWLTQYHVDGLRVDGVSSMLFLNFGIENESEKIYNASGSEEDTDAISFLRELAYVVGVYASDAFTVAEESSAWPLVTAPPENGGLGFHYKWDMGWMNDTLKYMKTDFPFRPGCHNLITFSMMYAFNENFLLPLSHDEVVHGKCSLITRMPGDYWRQFAGLRLLALYQATHTGGMLNFMGNEFGQFIEWRYYEGLEWFLLEYDSHRKHQEFIRALNHVYSTHKPLWACDNNWRGFTWLDADNAEQGVISYIRSTESKASMLIVVLNAHPQTYSEYRIGVPKPGYYSELLNSDAEEFGGSGKTNPGEIKAEPIPLHGQPYSIAINVPPIGGAIFRKIRRKLEETK